MPPAGAGPDHLITHRIASIGRDAHRQAQSSAPRATPTRPPTRGPSSSGATQARVRRSLPYAGFALAALSAPRLRISLIGAPRAADRARQPRRALAAARRRGGGARRAAGRRHEARSPPSRSALAALARRLGARPSGADFLAASANPANIFGAAADFNTVAVSLADPGTPLRGTVDAARRPRPRSAAIASREASSARRPAPAPGRRSAPRTTAPYTCDLDTAGSPTAPATCARSPSTSAGYSRTAAVASRARRQHAADASR